ncbi:MAG: histidine kinase dimerization/phosphoacceptor domain -containing protein [Bacteroidota bacterium]
MNKTKGLFFIAFLAICWSGAPLIAQSTGVIDSLKAIIALHTNDKQAVGTLMELAKRYDAIDLDSSLIYINAAEKIAATLNDASTNGLVAQMKGIYYTRKSVYQEAVGAFTKAIEYYQQTGNAQNLADNFGNLSNSYMNLGDNLNALKYVLMAYDLFSKEQNKERMMKALGALTVIYGEDKDTTNAFKYAYKALDMAMETNQKTEIARAFIYIAQVCFSAGQYERAVSMYEQARLAIDSKNFSPLIPHIKLKTANCYLQLKKYPNALQAYEAAYQGFAILRDTSKMYSAKLGTAKVQVALKNYAPALQIARKIEAQIIHSGQLEKTQDIYFLFYNAYSGIKNFEAAHKYAGLLLSVQDSLYDQNKKKELYRLQVQFATKEKEEEIRLLSKDKKLEELEEKRQELLRNIFIAALFIVLIFTLLLWNRYRAKIRTNNLLKVQQEDIRQANENLLKTLLEKNRLLEEKELLFKEVHHRVKNNLQLMNSLLNLQINTTNSAELTRSLEESQSRLQSISLIHEKLYQQEDLFSLNFDEYIKSLVSSLHDVFNSKAQQIAYQVESDPIHLDVETTLRLGLIINELTINALKHAFPQHQEGKIEISLRTFDADNYMLSVKDNGIGIDETANAKFEDSLGMRLVNVLSNQLDGVLTILNNNGTHVYLKFPSKSIL